MSSSEQKGAEPSKSLLEIWNKPIVRYLVATIAATSGIAKLIESQFKPSLPAGAKLTLWIVFFLALLPFAAHFIVLGLKRLLKNVVEQQRREEAISARSGEDVNGEVAYVFNSRLYGRAYEELKAHCTIRGDGSAAFRREVELVAYSPISDIDVYMLLPEAPQNGEDRLRLAKVESLTPFMRIAEEPKRLSSGQIYLRMHFSPTLGPGQHVRYQVMEESSPGLYAITGLEERKMPYDYFAWDITIPTKALEVKVLFPEGVHPQKFEPDVWHALGQGQSTHNQEYERVKSLLIEQREGVFYTLVFEVPHPILGLTYVIRWVPPRVA